MMKTALIAVAAGLLTVTAGCSGIDQKKLEPVYRSAKAVEAGATAGVSYMQFRELLQPLQTELAIARDRVSNEAERGLVADYGKAADLYQDSAALWALKIEHGPFLSDDGAATALATKHGLRRTEIGTIDADAGIRSIWAQAAVWTGAGTAVYTGH